MTGSSRAARWLPAAAVAVYLCCAAALITARPGLQYDEALMVLGAVHMRHSPGELTLPHDPDTWVCPGRCFPLMTVRYVGALKEYVAMAAFALFGTKTSVIRFVSALLACLCVWGTGRFTARYVTPAAGGAAALILAVHPSFVDQTVFDNGAVAVWMFALGGALAALAAYAGHPRPAAAAAAGFFAGLGVWSRANFAWLVLAAVAGFAPKLWRWLRTSPRDALAAAAGGLAGAAPLLAYQAVSGFGTLEAAGMFQAAERGTHLLAIRTVMWAESLVADREHRAIWNGPPELDTVYWTVPLLVMAALAVCLASRYRPLAVVALAFYFLLFSSRLPVAEHHLVTALPLVAMAVAAAGNLLAGRYRRARAALAVLAAIYAGVAVCWQVGAAAGIRATGGTGQWSDAIVAVAQELEHSYAGRDVKIADWGLQNNLYVITDGRVRSREIYPNAQSAPDPAGFWREELNDGGLYLANGPENAQMKEVAAAFAAEVARRGLKPVKTFVERGGRTYALLYDVPPGRAEPLAPAPSGTLESTIEMRDPARESQLVGFHQIEQGSYRWSRRRFAIALKAPEGRSRLVVELYIPEDVVRRLGPLTLSAAAGGRKLEPQTFTTPGKFRFEREIRSVGGPLTVSFELDKAYIEPGEGRELGVVVSSAGLYP